jgi:HEAT repeat protein
MIPGLILVGVLAQASAGVQQAAPATDLALVASGWSALAEGRSDSAITNADRVLARRPWDHDAIALKVNALAAGDPIKALDAYESWLGKGSDDAGLLEPIAREVARAAATGPQGPLRRDARRMLTAAHVQLPAAAAADDEPFARDAAAALSGSADALQRLEAVASSPNIRNKTALVAALEQVGPPAANGLIAILQQDVRGPAAGDAARALGKIGATEAIPALQAAMNAPEPYTRYSASVALARLGDPAGLSAVDAMLATSVPDVQLMAAETLSGQNGPWVGTIMPLLDNPDGLTRFRAARLIARYYPDAARRTFEQGATDPNPVIRSEALQMAIDAAPQQPSILDLQTLRRQLRDEDLAVRLSVAGAILAAARSR